MSLDRPVAGARTPYPILADALRRHLEWAHDFAVAGDVDLAVDALRDAQAAFGELHDADPLRDAGEHWFATMSPVTDRDALSALRELSAWATGVRLAYEILEDDAGSSA